MHRSVVVRRLVLGLAAMVVAVSLVGSSSVRPASAAPRDEATILLGEATSLDPALQGDVGSARVSAQLFESLTAIDPGLAVRPALAGSWDIVDGGRRVVFHISPGLTFSDGSPLGAADVVRSWLRIINPASPSPLASLMTDVEGATDYLRGVTTDPARVGLAAVGSDVEVRLTRPAADFPAVVASPTFAVVPPAVGATAAALTPGSGFVASGGYRAVRSTSDELTLEANDHYWAGPPAITTIHAKTSLAGASPVDVFGAGQLDYTPISTSDAFWIRYDPQLGKALRTVPSLSLTYYGFDTSRPPFNDPQVRRAFGQAVDWKRIATLVSGGSAIPANSMVPPGIPGRSERDFLPKHDPEAARAELATAGYPGGAGFPEVTLVSFGSGYDEGIVADLKRELGIQIRFEAMEGDPYFVRLAADPPAFWVLGWVADYPGPNDFLGLLLGTGSTNDYGRWSQPEFDAAISRALGAPDPAAARAAYDDAESIVQRDVPVVPLSYEAGYALSRDGLLGATESGLGIIRLAGLAWADR